MSTPRGVPPLASTGGAAQTKSQAGVTGNACCLVGEGGEGATFLHGATLYAVNVADYVRRFEQDRLVLCT